MQTPPNNIKAIRKARGLTQGELGELVGLSQAQVARIERQDRGTNLARINQIATALGCSVGDLLPNATSSPQGVSSVESLVQRVPVISWVQAGTYTAAEAVNMENAEEFIHIISNKRNLFAVQVVGNSMSRVAPEGAYVVVDRTDTQLIDKKLYLFRDGEWDTTFKQYRDTEGPVRLEPLSFNPGHKTIYPEGEVSVIGRVIEISQRV